MSLHKEANLLLKLVNVESMALNTFSKNKKLLDKLRSLGVIDILPSGRGRMVKKDIHFDSYVARNFNGDLSTFIEIGSRGEDVVATGDDKSKRIAPQKGLFLWSNHGIEVTDGCIINNIEGVITFVHDRIAITLPEDVLIIGVENFESLTYAPRLFEPFGLSQEKKTLFVYRNASFGKLLQKARNTVIYLPDYDIFGIRIYETEVLKYNPNASMAIPKGMERILESIETEKKYLDQSMMKGSDYIPVTSTGTHVWKLLKEHCKIIPQEYFHAC